GGGGADVPHHFQQLGETAARTRFVIHDQDFSGGWDFPLHGTILELTPADSQRDYSGQPINVVKPLSFRGHSCTTSANGMPLEEAAMTHAPKQHHAPALETGKVREVISGALAPGFFYAAQPVALEWETAVPESGPWEVFQGRLLDR